MKGIYLNNWSSKEEVQNDFEVQDLEGIKILLASYGTPSYEGYAFVVFKRDGKLYEVNASHCSCYGLEDQWDPEETTKKSLLYRIKEGTLGSDDYTDNIFKDELLEVLKRETER